MSVLQVSMPPFQDQRCAFFALEDESRQGLDLHFVNRVLRAMRVRKETNHTLANLVGSQRTGSPHARLVQLEQQEELLVLSSVPLVCLVNFRICEARRSALVAQETRLV